MSDISAPVVKIIWPPEESIANAEEYDIIGVSYDPSNINNVEVTLTIPTTSAVSPSDQQAWEPAVQLNTGSWYIWRKRIKVQNTRFKRILARARDGAGNFGYDDKFITYPEPPPPVSIEWNKLVGVNYLSPVPRRKEKEPSINADQAYEAKWIADLGLKKVNFVRVAVYWESMYPYATNRNNVLEQLKFIAIECKKNNVKMVVNNHHFHGSSSWKFTRNGSLRTGGGFPSYVVAGYNTDQTLGSVYANPDVKLFFEHLYTDTNKNVDIWEEMFEQFWRPVIETLDPFESVIGYEILNELQIFDTSQYQKAGLFHTAIGQRMRNLTVKAVVWDEGNVRGPSPEPGKQYLMAPKVSNHVYAPHSYAVGTKFEQHMQQFKVTSQQLGNIPVFVGEFSTGTSDAFDTTQASMDWQLAKLKQYNFGSSIWAYAPQEGALAGHNIINSNGTLTATGQRYLAARVKTYAY